MKTVISIIISILLMLTGSATALERFDVITTQEVKQLLKKRATGQEDFVLVNSLDEIIFRHTSIPGSVNVPLSRFNEHAFKLGDNKDRLIVIY